MANLFSSSVRPRSLAFHGFTVPNPKPKWKRRLNSGSLPFKPRLDLFVSFSASRGEELGIVSTSECGDGSVVFRFGDESEVEEERVRIAAAALVDEKEEECEEIEVIDEEIESATEGLVESSSLGIERIDPVEESVSADGMELSETMLEERVNLTEEFVDDLIDNVTEELVESSSSGMEGTDLVEESASVDEAVEGENGGGLELNETMLDERVNLTEGIVDEESDSEEVWGEIHSGIELSETVLDGSLHLEEGFVDDGVAGEISGGLRQIETLLDDSVGSDRGFVDEDSVNGSDEVEGEIDGGVFVVKDGVNSTEEVEGESDHGLELSEALLDEIVHVEEGSVQTDDVVESESVRPLDLSETLLEASVDLEEGYVENSGSESDCSLELSKSLPEASVDMEEGRVKDVVIGSASGNDVVESDNDRALDPSETLLEASADLEESHFENSASESEVVEFDSDRDHALKLSATLMEASVNIAKGHVENSDCATDLSETLQEASGNIEEGYVGSNMATLDCDGVLELTETLKSSIQLEEVPDEEVAELADVVEVESNAEDNGVSTSTLASSLSKVNHELNGDEFVTRYSSIERSKENANVEAPHNSKVTVNINVDSQVNNVPDELKDHSSSIQVLPISDTLEAEPVLEGETSFEPGDEPVETDRLTSLEMLDVSALSSNWLETITDDDAKSTNLAEEPIHNPIELQPTSLIREEVSRTELFLSSGAALFPVASKALTGREDAYFVASQHWLGVADGVSEWSLQGINVGSYAQELMENCEKIVLDSESIRLTNPIEVLSRSVSDTKSHGSSTALVAFFNGQALQVANIGDSGFIIVRNDTIFKRSSPMVHGINFPIHIERGDDPSKLVEEYDIALSEDDIIVIATDGLFDNLYEEEIASIASKSAQAGLEPQDIAELLAARALEVGSSAMGMSPFADVARAAGYPGRAGGKLDDVAVIVSLVQKRSNAQLKQV